MQLVAYGAQDIYLTGNPQITFFKVVYRRHTNFSMEAIQQTWNGSSIASGRCTATISRNGDLISRMYVEVGGEVAQSHSNPGVNWITNVELEIGGQKIDKHSGKFMEVYAELTQPNPSGIRGHIEDAANATGTLFQRMSGHGGVAGNDGGAIAGQRYNVPLQFWFCRNPGLALPLIALQYHEVKVILDHLITTTFTDAALNNLWVDYIYLDTDERRRFAQQSHEYLIEQVQEQGLSNNANNELNFNHPVKELIWAAHAGVAGNRASLRDQLTTITGVLLKLNGHDRFAARHPNYFTQTQVWEHHSGFGGLDSQPVDFGGGDVPQRNNDSIGVYSFALKPEEHQPSGTCNFSRIDNASFQTTGDSLRAETDMYAINYNVLRIMSGMGGLAYSN